LGGTCETLSEEAAAVTSSEGLVMLPFLSGERNPEIGSAASGVFHGLRTHHHRGHIVRAALEGVVFALSLVREALLRNHIPLGTVRVGGGAARSPLWMTMLATAFDTPLELSGCSEPGLVGAGMLGHAAAGRYSSVREASGAMTRSERRCDPDPTLAGEMSTGYERFQQLIGQTRESQREEWTSKN
ncbi:MAG: Carbohydrate kinase, partial [Capsulimonas sp.]|nr:Carbohydrate kinase [Capsulimonas sp.]